MDLVYKDRSINESWDGVTLNEWLADGGLPTDGYDPYLDFTSDNDEEDEDEQWPDEGREVPGDDPDGTFNDEDEDDEEYYIAWRERIDWLVSSTIL